MGFAEHENSSEATGERRKGQLVSFKIIENMLYETRVYVAFEYQYLIENQNLVKFSFSDMCVPQVPIAGDIPVE